MACDNVASPSRRERSNRDFGRCAARKEHAMTLAGDLLDRTRVSPPG